MDNANMNSLTPWFFFHAFLGAYQASLAATTSTLPTGFRELVTRIALLTSHEILNLEIPIHYEVAFESQLMADAIDSENPEAIKTQGQKLNKLALKAIIFESQAQGLFDLLKNESGFDKQLELLQERFNYKSDLQKLLLEILRKYLAT
jgi:hypothetical protein